MAKLEELRKGEERAVQELEQAQKDAQRTKLSITATIEEMKQREDENLKNVAKEAFETVKQKIDQLAKDLSLETIRKLELLEQNREKLEKAATENLRNYILNDRKES